MGRILDEKKQKRMVRSGKKLPFSGNNQQGLNIDSNSGIWREQAVFREKAVYFKEGADR